MSVDIAQLRAKVAFLKSAPIFSKAAIAEQTMDLLIVILAKQQLEIDQLKGVQHGKG